MLGLLLFIVLVNDIGFSNQEYNVGELITCKRILRAANQLQLQFVEDLTLAESLILRQSVVSSLTTERPPPDQFHSRTGHSLIQAKSKVFEQIIAVHKYSKENDMQLNLKKTKFMLFNQCKTIDFQPSYTIESTEIETVEETKLLGAILTSDLKFDKNTEYIVKRAYLRIWILRRLKNLGTTIEQLTDVYTKQILSILELAIPLWQSSLTQSNKISIERVQKSALQVILGPAYESYRRALKTIGLSTLEERRENICKTFAEKAIKNSKHKNWFKVNKSNDQTRRQQQIYCNVFARTKRIENSPMSYLTRILNKNT